MKVSVAYTIMTDIEIEIDNKFQALSNDELSLAKQREIEEELVEACEEHIPMGGFIHSIAALDTDEMLYEY